MTILQYIFILLIGMIALILLLIGVLIGMIALIL